MTNITLDLMVSFYLLQCFEPSVFQCLFYIVLHYSHERRQREFYVYGSVHHNIFYEITNRCSYMQTILFHC